MPLRAAFLIVALLLPLHTAPARGDAPFPVGLLDALAGRSSNDAAWDPAFEYTLKRFFPSDVLSDYLVTPAPVSFVLKEVIALPSRIPVQLAARQRFLVLHGCRPHACIDLRGMIVIDLATGSICAALYQFETDPYRWDGNEARAADKPTSTVGAEIFVPALSESTRALIETCAARFALTTQRLVPNGFWVERGDIRARVAPDFRSDPEMAGRFRVWDGRSQPY